MLVGHMIITKWKNDLLKRVYNFGNSKHHYKKKGIVQSKILIFGGTIPILENLSRTTTAFAYSNSASLSEM